jgi:hypothetical protein
MSINDNIKKYDDFKIEKIQKLSIPENNIAYTLTLPLITIINYTDTVLSIKNKVFWYSRKEANITTSYKNEATTIFTDNKCEDIMLYDIISKKFYILNPDVENKVENKMTTLQKYIKYKNTEDSNITSPAEFYLKHKGGEKYIILKIYIGLIFIIHKEVLIILDNIGEKSDFTCVIYNLFKEINLDNIKMPKDEFGELFDIVKNNAIINETLINYFE